MYYTNKDALAIPNYEIYFTKSADKIIEKAAKIELENVLSNFYISERSIIKGGGGLSKIKQSLSEAFVSKQWRTNKHLVKPSVSEPKLAHIKDFSDQTIGLDILWNNKDSFFDTHLEYYSELYDKHELNLCIMITRGTSLQNELPFVYDRFIDNLDPFNIDELCKHIEISKKMTAEYQKIFESPILIKAAKVKKIARSICSSKFGSSTSHMGKLLPRIEQGNFHCPLIIIGIGKERLKR